MSPGADSAGQPWEGRHFEPNAHTADDGSAPPAYRAAIAALRAGETTLAAVVDVVRDCRFLIPLVAVAGETGLTDDGHLVDKTQELSIITVVGPDGRPVLADAVRVALAAAAEHTDRVVVDARSPETLLVLPRPAVWAIAQGVPWVPAVDDPAVLEAVARPAAAHPEIWAVTLLAGDPQGRGEAPEVIVRLGIGDETPPERLRAIIAALSQAWAADATVAERIDALTVQPVRGAAA